jgi:succinyl-CoA synthetase beta subunit
MDLLEYEGKRLFVDAGLPVLAARVAATAAEAAAAAAPSEVGALLRRRLEGRRAQ